MNSLRAIFVLLTLLLLTTNHEILAQNHVKWEARYDKETCELVISATIDDKWHLYSINNAEDLGPVPTVFTFPKIKGLKLKGQMKEQAPIIAHDPNFGATLGYHENKVEFRQKVKIKKLKSFAFKVYYMVCDDSQCLPPTEVTLDVKIS